MSNPQFKIVILPANEKEYKTLQKSLAARGVLFASTVDGEESKKSAEEIKLEVEFTSLSGLKRFRLTKENSALVESGEKTRLDFLRAAVKSLRKSAAATSAE